MTVAEVLRAARALIEKPERWTQGADARNVEGNALSSTHGENAVCWCAVGALTRVCPDGNDARTNARRALRDAICAIEPPAMFKDAIRAIEPLATISGFNDSHTHAEVLAAFDRAIAAAEAKP